MFYGPFLLVIVPTPDQIREDKFLRVRSFSSLRGSLNALHDFFFFDEFRLRVFCSRTKPSCATFECHSFVIDFLPGAFFLKRFYLNLMTSLPAIKHISKTLSFLNCCMGVGTDADASLLLVVHHSRHKYTHKIKFYVTFSGRFYFRKIIAR